ncbi:MAG: hypothetical protein LEGION0398_MBIBDBAK_00223 [Legionellaceae bacterium]
MVTNTLNKNRQSNADLVDDTHPMVTFTLWDKVWLFFYQPFYKKLAMSFLLVFLIALYGVSYFYVYRTIANVPEITPFIFFKQTVELFFAGKLPALLSLSIVLPVLIFGSILLFYYMGGFRWLIAGFFALMGFWVWSFLSDTLLLSLAKHDFLMGESLDYVRRWFFYYHDTAAKKALEESGVLSALILVILAVIWKRQAIPNIYGKAKFGTHWDLFKNKLFSKEGIFLAYAFGKAICQRGYEHVILFAPTGQGKTSNFAMTNLLRWKDSCIVTDTKLTLFQLTSGYRTSLGQTCYLFCPADKEGKTHRYNPLDFVSRDPKRRVDEIQVIAHILIPDIPGKDDIWTVQPRQLFIALVLYVMDTEELPCSIGQVVKLVKQTENFADWLKQLLASRPDLDSVARDNFNIFINAADETRSSILSSFDTYFEVFSSPMVLAATSHSDFDIRELRRKKMTIYVGCNDNDLARLAPLISIFFQQVISLLTEKVPDENEPYGLLMLLDEFASLRRMDSLQSVISRLREYRIRMAIIVQELSQLVHKYGREGAKMFINSKVRIAYTQNDEDTANYLSSQLGSKTCRIQNRSRQHNARVFSSSSGSESEQLIKRDLMLPQEIRQLPKDKALILIEGENPIYADKIPWYKNLALKSKIMRPIEIPSILSLLNNMDLLIKKVSFYVAEEDYPDEEMAYETNSEDESVDTQEETADLDKDDKTINKEDEKLTKQDKKIKSVF